MWRHADTVGPLPVRDNLDSRNHCKEPDSAEVACGTLTTSSHHPARPSIAYGGPTGNWNVVDSSRHERDGGNGHGYPPDGGIGRGYPQPARPASSGSLLETRSDSALASPSPQAMSIKNKGVLKVGVPLMQDLQKWAEQSQSSEDYKQLMLETFEAALQWLAERRVNVKWKPPSVSSDMERKSSIRLRVWQISASPAVALLSDEPKVV